MSDLVQSQSTVAPVAGQTRARWRPTTGVILTLLALHVVVLRAMGRIWWCACGSPNPIGHRGEHNSQHLLDWYTPSHVLHGVVFYWLLAWWMRRATITTRAWVAVAIEVAWEFVENTPLIIDRYRAATTAVSYYGDSIANSVSDVVACLLGFLLARRIGWVGSILTFIGFELLTLIVIRDNLTLNVLMLVWPLDAVRQWQGRPV